MDRIESSDRNFGQQLEDDSVYPNDEFFSKPANWDELWMFNCFAYKPHHVTVLLRLVRTQ